MTLYLPTNLNTLLTGATDPEGDTIVVYRINGSIIDWSSEPYNVGLSVGSCKVWKDGTVRFDDGGSTSGHPTAGNSQANGSFTFTLWDLSDESSTYTATISLESPAAGDVTAPTVTGMVPAAASTDVNIGTSFVVSLSEQCQFATGGIEIYNFTDVVSIETIATTSTGPGAGTVEMGSSQFTVTPTSNLPAGKSVGLKWSAGVVKDLAGNNLAAVTTNALAVTTAVSSLTNTIPVAISGTPEVGNTLTAVPGTWTGGGSLALTYQWYRDGVAIGSATNSTYLLLIDDANKTVTVRETCTSTPTPPAAQTVEATGFFVTTPANIRSSLEIEILDAWTNNGWEGFTSETGFTVFTATTPDEVKTRWDTWRNGTPGSTKVKVVCDWDGILNATATTWNGVGTAKLTANASALGGYTQPEAGGFWLAAAPGKTPKWGTTLRVYGPTKLHIDGLTFCGQANGGNGDNIYALRASRSATFPIIGRIALTNCNFGLKDNKPALAWTEMIKAIFFEDCLSNFFTGNRFAGCRDTLNTKCQYRKMEKNQFQDNLSDVCTQFGLTSAAFWAGRTVYDIDQLNLVRDLHQEVNATGLHTDRSQKGQTNDAHAGYKTLRRWNLTHMKSSTAFDSQSQIFYQDDATTQRFDAVHYDSLECAGGYHHSVCFDQNGAGHYWAERLTLLRAGDYYTNDPYTQILVSTAVGSHPATAGGSITVKDCVVGKVVNPASRTMSVSGMKYVTPVKNHPAGGDGSTEALAIRMENYVTGTVNRAGDDRCTYTITGENNVDFATAWYALRDFYAPVGGYNNGSGTGCTDPETWPGAPVRP